MLLGGGGHCRSCIDVIEKQQRYEVVGILDKADTVGLEVVGYRILGTDEDIPMYIPQGCAFLITFGQVKSSLARETLFTVLKDHGAILATVISPRAYVSKHASVGMGSIVMHDALINSGARVGKNCIVNTKALVEHDAVVEDHSHVSTAAVVNGGTIVRRGSFFGSNAVSKEYVETSPQDFIKMGSAFRGR